MILGLKKNFALCGALQLCCCCVVELPLWPSCLQAGELRPATQEHASAFLPRVQHARIKADPAAPELGSMAHAALQQSHEVRGRRLALAAEAGQFRGERRDGSFGGRL